MLTSTLWRIICGMMLELAHLASAQQRQTSSDVKAHFTDIITLFSNIYALPNYYPPPFG